MWKKIIKKENGLKCWPKEYTKGNLECFVFYFNNHVYVYVIIIGKFLGPPAMPLPDLLGLAEIFIVNLVMNLWTDSSMNTISVKKIGVYYFQYCIWGSSTSDVKVSHRWIKEARQKAKI